MKKIFAGAACAFTLALAGPVVAADAPAPMAAAPYVEPLPPIYSWTGGYAGVSVGWGGLSNSGVDVFPNSPASLAFYGPAILAGQLPLGLSSSANGFVAGPQIGYNWQVNQAVIGVEADINWSGIDGGTTFLAPTGGGNFVVSGADQSLDWLATLRLRLGLLAGDNFLLYATGGLAVGDVSTGYTYFASATGNFISGGTDKTRWGWTAGVGGEGRVAPNMSIKAEVLYFDLGDQGFTAVGGNLATGLNGFNMAGNAETAGWVGRVGVNFHFN